ncbi:unnamed protein product [Rangifer tarandus platyrhynchus]|uniref:Uncharacterized protein n=2 Tax=Rangifer tarandus platyrhynchus TaxID=3082113 RepID=A0ABN8YEI4_RANTA|nr:unnamed protein product [Rangifer tarandus platyrhynchus]
MPFFTLLSSIRCPVRKKIERYLRWPQPLCSCTGLTTAVSFPNREMGQGLFEGRGSGLNLLTALLPLPALWSPLYKLNSAICLMRPAGYCRGVEGRAVTLRFSAFSDSYPLKWAHTE